MNNVEKEYYALQDANGNLIGIDRDSGGYPWIPGGIVGVYFLENIEDAKKYQKVFPEYTVVSVKLIVEKA